MAQDTPASDSGPQARGRRLVRRFFDDVFNERRHDAAAEVLASDFVAHHPAFPEGIRGVDGVMQTAAVFREGFSDLRYEVDDLVAEGDRVACRWTARGTHDGVFMGVPASGRPAVFVGCDIFRVADDRLVEAWVVSDLLGVMQQIGALPTPQQDAAPERP